MLGELLLSLKVDERVEPRKRQIQSMGIDFEGELRWGAQKELSTGTRFSASKKGFDSDTSAAKNSVQVERCVYSSEKKLAKLHQVITISC